MNATMISDDTASLYSYPTAIDISDRKRMEDELRESEERFRTSFRTSPDSMSISRLSDGRLRGSQRRFHETFGVYKR